jgi:hypothetical protein
MTLSIKDVLTLYSVVNRLPTKQYGGSISGRYTNFTVVRDIQTCHRTHPIFCSVSHRVYVCVMFKAVSCNVPFE